MVILRIEHKVPNFEAWKKAFEGDPLNRKKSGVRRHRIFRPADDPNDVIVDLEFDERANAEAMLAALRNVWGQVEGKIIIRPQTRVLDVVETITY